MTRVANLDHHRDSILATRSADSPASLRPSTKSSIWTTIGSHWRTLSPHFIPVPKGRAPRRTIRFSLEDPRRGKIWLTGSLRVPEGAKELLVLVHGLGGSSDSSYIRSAALHAERMGLATFSLCLRGADRRGEDFYNIALTADLHAAMVCKELSAFTRIDLLGFSMGGHVVLTYATEVVDQRVRSVAALCTPLDLEIEQQYFDHDLHPLYRWHVLRGLKSIYSAVAQKRAVPSELSEVMAVKTVREWDRLTIAPRYGYPNPETYYRELSVGPKLPKLCIPALLIAIEHDPIVPERAILDPLLKLSDYPALLDVRWVHSGGHIALSRNFHLGQAAKTGLLPQVAAWMRSRAIDS